MSSKLCLLLRAQFWVPWQHGNLSCPSSHSDKMLHHFHTVSFISMMYQRSPLLQLLPQGCFTCCCGLLKGLTIFARRQIASTTALLVIPFYISRCSQFHTYLFEIHGSHHSYFSTWSHCPETKYTSVLPHGTTWALSHLVFSVFVLQL